MIVALYRLFVPAAAASLLERNTVHGLPESSVTTAQLCSDGSFSSKQRCKGPLLVLFFSCICVFKQIEFPAAAGLRMIISDTSYSSLR